MDYFDILLAKKLNGGGGDITIEDLAITANGEYTAPSGKAYGKVTANVPAPANAIFKQTLTGLPSPIATFTGADAPIDELVISVDAVQDLHGYDSPWPAGGGKNKFNKNGSLENNRFIQADGTIVSSPNWNTTDYQQITPNTYTMSGATEGVGGYYGICWYDSEKTYIGGFQKFTTSPQTVTIPSNAQYVRYSVNNSALDSFMLEQGSVASSYAPYSNICPISGWSSANVLRVGKNWLSTNFTSGKGINSSGAVVDNSNRSATVEAIRAIPNTTYTVSYTGNERWGWVAYNSNNEKIDSATLLYSGDNFTTPLGTYYVRFIYASETAPTNVQLELGTSTTYEPYNGTNVLISFGQEIFGGYLNVSTGELTILYALIDMGDMAWTYQSANTRFVSSDIQSLSKYPSSNDNPSNIMCSNYANNSYRDYTDKQIAQSNTGNVFIKDSTYTDATTFKTAMDGVQLVYELATPTTIQLTPTQVRTLLGNNNVFADCGEVMELKYYSETP